MSEGRNGGERRGLPWLALKIVIGHEQERTQGLARFTSILGGLMRVDFLRFAIVLIGSASGPALADVVVMQNGDRITGEVNRIWGNDLSVEPDYADEFVLELDKVSYIESDR